MQVWGNMQERNRSEDASHEDGLFPNSEPKYIYLSGIYLSGQMEEVLDPEENHSVQNLQASQNEKENSRTDETITQTTSTENTESNVK